MDATDDAVLTAGVRWLATKRVTLGVIAVLFAVFLFELAVLETLGARSWQYLFLAGVDPSPGWVLAPFAHRDLGHLVTTTVVVLVYGTLVEDLLPAVTYFGFYVAAGYASTIAQLGVYTSGASDLGTLGASGAALGLVALFTTTTAVGPTDRERSEWTVVRRLFAVTGVVIIGLLVVNDFAPGLQFAAGTAPYGHVGGMLTGVFYGLYRTQAQHRRARPP